MLKTLSLQGFVRAVASRESLPGGGCVAALAGALGAALAAMTARPPLSKPQTDASEEVQQLRADADRMMEELLSAVERDADSYREVLAAFRLPKGDGEAVRRRGEAIQSAYKQATEEPIRVAEAALQVMELAGRAALLAPPDMISDAGVGILMARAAGLGALLNVRANLAFIDDEHYVSRMKERAGGLRARILEKERGFPQVGPE